jgi:hypothetical protein
MKVFKTVRYPAAAVRRKAASKPEISQSNRSSVQTVYSRLMSTSSGITWCIIIIIIRVSAASHQVRVAAVVDVFTETSARFILTTVFVDRLAIFLQLVSQLETERARSERFYSQHPPNNRLPSTAVTQSSTSRVVG